MAAALTSVELAVNNAPTVNDAVLTATPAKTLLATVKTSVVRLYVNPASPASEPALLN